MATRKPIVSVNGTRRQLPDGDRLAGVPAYIHAYDEDDQALELWAAGEGALPVTLEDGTSELEIEVAYG